MRVVIPAYIFSELKTGFQIGAILFLPFLVIDMVTASVTTSIGMMQLPPVVISTPLKILLFVVADGWNLVVGSMLKSFHCEARRCRRNKWCSSRRQTLEAAFWVAMPILLSAMAVSLVINIGQVMTSVQDTTVTTVPRLAAVGIIVFLLTPWMLHHLVAFTSAFFSRFSSLHASKEREWPSPLEMMLARGAAHRHAARRGNPDFCRFSAARRFRAQIKALLVLVLTAAAVSGVSIPTQALTTFVVMRMALSETMLGLVMGLCVQFVFEGAQMAGQIGGFQLSFSLANVIDPQTNIDTPVLAIL